MGVEQGTDPDLLGTDVNWQMVHGQPPKATDPKSVMQEVMAGEQYQALSHEQQADVQHVLHLLLEDKSINAVTTLTPEADEVVSSVINDTRGFLGSKEIRPSEVYSYSTTNYPDIARLKFDRPDGSVSHGFAVLHEGKKPWE